MAAKALLLPVLPSALLLLPVLAAGMVLHVRVKTTVPLSPDQAYARFIEVVWRGGGGLGTPKFLEVGDENGGKSRRVVPGNIIEQALEATPPNFFEYAVVGGPFPVVRHRGVVSFLELTGEGTDVIWDVEFQPSSFGNAFCCCGAGLVVLVRVSLGSMLRTLRRSCG